MAEGLTTYHALLEARNRLMAENEELRWQLEEAAETIEAIRTGQIDALVVQTAEGSELYSLKTADQTYRVFIEQMNEGALTLNAAGIILYSNSMFAKMVGQPLPQVIGQEFCLLLIPEHQDMYREFCASGWEGESRIELSLDGPDGPVPVQLSVTSLEQPGEAIATNVLVTDLSYQKEVQDLLKRNNEQLAQGILALERSNSDLQQFASVASHDLQEPLRKMEVFSNLLKTKMGPDAGEDMPRYLDKIITSAARMKRLVSDILSYTRLAADQPENEAVPLNALVAEILEDFELLITDKKATITVDELPTIFGARAQLRQVFQNLISNALKFSQTDLPPVITIACGPCNAKACTVTVTDNGIGFDAQYSNRVFSLFERLNTKDAYEGSGIGLAVSKKIIESHGGSIAVSSTPEVGSCFSIVLPVGAA